MSDNANSKRYHKEIESEICIDEIMLNKNYFQKSQDLNNISNKNLKNFHSNQANILLNSLQDFYTRYEKDDRKILSNNKFIISFQEIISLIREAMVAQQQIDNIIYNNIDDNKNINNINIQKINQKYITDLSYNIFSFEKIDMGYGFNIKKKKKIYSNISPNNYKFQNDSKSKKSSNISISPNNIKKEINTIFENIYKEVFINGNDNPFNNIERKNNKKKSKNKNHNHERNKSAFINNNIKNISPLKYHKVSKNKDNQRINNTVINTNIKNNISYNHSNININNNYNSKGYNSFSSNKNNFENKGKNDNKKVRKSKTFKNKNKGKDKLKSSNIYMACQKIDMIKNSGNKNILSRSNNNYFNNNETFMKKSLKSLGLRDLYNSINYTDIIGYEELKFNTGIKKIIVSNTHKPSNLANKLLISGQKYIDDFKEINEGTKRKKI